ncbi:MAG: deoxynucleoside kinase [Deltaproteobacteria bacterium]|nr:deoxynucleoside kinase [Deltaproteobacteria bacterium]
MGQRKYIAVAGNMGVGKSSLVRFLCQHFKVEPFFEPNEQNPYLKDFYRDMRRWAFHSQVRFLSSKFRIHQDLARERIKTTVIQDRSIYEDAEIFAYNLFRSRKMSKRDYETYQSLYQTMVRSLEPPDLMIYLRGSLRTLKRRIRARGRPEEKGMPDSYLRRLNGYYEEWFERYSLSPTLVIQTDNMDYATDLVDRIDLVQQIEKYI